MRILAMVLGTVSSAVLCFNCGRGAAPASESPTALTASDIDAAATPRPSTCSSSVASPGVTIPVDPRPLLAFAEDCTDETNPAGSIVGENLVPGCISPLDVIAASKAAAAAIVRACNTPPVPDDRGRLYVVFKNDGSVAAAVAQDPWRTSSLRGCVESAARSVRVRPFVGRSRTYGMVFEFPAGGDASIQSPILFAPDAGR
jgi:hypothetical protein